MYTTKIHFAFDKQLLYHMLAKLSRVTCANLHTFLPANHFVLKHTI